VLRALIELTAGLGVVGLFGPRTGNSSGVLPGKLSGGAGSPGSRTGVGTSGRGFPAALQAAAPLDCRVSEAVSPEVRSAARPFPVLLRSVQACEDEPCGSTHSRLIGASAIVRRSKSSWFHRNVGGHRLTIPAASVPPAVADASARGRRKGQPAAGASVVTHARTNS
jgi:hypothetical protein